MTRYIYSNIVYRYMIYIYIFIDNMYVYIMRHIRKLNSRNTLILILTCISTLTVHMHIYRYQIHA